jgi:chitinase
MTKTTTGEMWMKALVLTGLFALMGCAPATESAASGEATSSYESAVVVACNTPPNWVEGKAYAARDIVKYIDDKLYIAKFANPGYIPTVSTYFWAPFAGYPAWSGQTQYAAGDIVRYTNGSLYIAKFANPGYNPTISTYFWDPVSCSVAPIPTGCGAAPNWVSGTAYAAGDTVKYTDGKLYTAKFANPGYVPTVSTYFWAPANCSVAPVPGAAVITAVAASNITKTTAMISWTLSERGTGQVEYGTTSAYGQRNTPELSFNYSAHSQPLNGLTPGTLYHFRVSSQNQAGITSVSGDFTFITASDAPVAVSNLPAKVVGGYFTTWEPRNGASLRTFVDSTNYNLIYVSFATGTSASSGALQLSVPPGATSAADFKSQVAYANSKGVKVLISVGGWFDLGGFNSGYVLDSTKKVDEFMVSMRDFRNNWGFNGMDWDLEHGTRPDTDGIVDASRRMKAEFGSTWIINCAPAPEQPSWVGAGGILDRLGVGGWDAVGEQLYGQVGVTPAEYKLKIIARMTALSNKYGSSKVMLGTTYRQESPSAAPDPSGGVPIATAVQSLTDLRASGINIRGAFLWTIQSDSDQSFAWSTGVGGDILSHP